VLGIGSYAANKALQIHDDTDGDKIPNFLDQDDDGDSILTKNELSYDVNGNVILPFDDCDGDGIPNYLDTDPCP
jgi:hypothetical protein